MARRRAATGATSDAEGSRDLCQCPELFNAKDPPGTTRCLLQCDNAVHKDWLKCRPCALGWHKGVPCQQVVPDSVPTLMKTCARCGFDTASHERGSDGRPFSEA
jgi:hypothetical protein